MEDLTGRKFNRLTVTGFDQRKHSHKLWFCICECGEKRSVREAYLKNGRTKSCGCYNRQRSSEYHRVHGQSYQDKKFTSEYQAWANMVKRCVNPNVEGYEYWGGRGITVCERWRSFENFFEDMREKPSKNHSLDRIDNNKGYSPENCRWTDASSQVINRRLQKNNSTGVRGVSWYSTLRKYEAAIQVKGEKIRLGLFDDLEEAKQAREKAEKKYWKSS